MKPLRNYFKKIIIDAFIEIGAIDTNPIQIAKKPHYSITEACKLMHVSYYKLKELITQGKIKTTARSRVPVAEIEKYLKGN